jgi:hypothetical protein
MIRNAAAQDIVAFLGILEPKNWPECLTLLVNQLDEQDALHQEVCFISPHFRSILLVCLEFVCASAALALLHAMPMPILTSAWLCQKTEREFLPHSLPTTSRHRKARYVPTPNIAVIGAQKTQTRRDNQSSASTTAVLLFRGLNDFGLLQPLL